MPAEAAAAPTYFDSPAAFRRWLQRHAATEAELLVGFVKTGTGRAGMTWPQSVDEALCFGWIDGVRRRVDDEHYSIRFTPRRPGSIWSAINIAKYEALCADGRMTPAGVAAHAHRRAEKSVIYSYEQPETARLSDADERVFRRARKAWAWFEAAPPGYRKQMLHWVTTARRDATRESRLRTLIDACAAGQRLR